MLYGNSDNLYMDSTEKTIATVMGLLHTAQNEEWLRQKTVLQEISSERKLNKKARKKSKAEEFRKNRIKV